MFYCFLQVFPQCKLQCWSRTTTSVSKRLLTTNYLWTERRGLQGHETLLNTSEMTDCYGKKKPPTEFRRGCVLYFDYCCYPHIVQNEVKCVALEQLGSGFQKEAMREKLGLKTEKRNWWNRLSSYKLTIVCHSVRTMSKVIMGPFVCFSHKKFLFMYFFSPHTSDTHIYLLSSHLSLSRRCSPTFSFKLSLYVVLLYHSFSLLP